MKWYRKAAEQGDLTTQERMAEIYEEGKVLREMIVNAGLGMKLRGKMDR